MAGLALFGEGPLSCLNSEEVALDEEDEKKLEALNKALYECNTSNKSIYSLWVRYFTHGATAKSDIKSEAMLAYSYIGLFYPAVLRMDSTLVFYLLQTNEVGGTGSL